MRRHITKKQWNEITKEQQKVILNLLLEKNEGIAYINTRFGDKYYFNIGLMIDLLGDHLCRIKHEIYNEDEYKLQMEVFNAKWTWIVILYDRTFLKEELTDALWKAIKYILNNEK